MRKTLVLFLVSILLSGCYAFKGDGDKPTVTVSIPPYMWFVNQIAGETLNVNAMMPLSGNPATYAPTMRQMQRLENSDLYIAAGHLGFENNWMKSFTDINSKMKVEDASVGLELLEGSCSHEEGAHHHHGIDPHVWVSPKSAQGVIKNIYRILVANYPKDSAYYRANYHELLLSMQELDVMMQETIEKASNKTFIIYHPALSYVARDYGLEQLQIEADGKMPSMAHVKEMVDAANSRGIKHILIQKQFDKTAANTIAKELDGNVIVIDPLGEKWSHQTLKLINTFSNILN